MANITAELTINGKIDVTGDLKGTITPGGGAGKDTLQEIFDGKNNVSFVQADNAEHKCYGFIKPFNITLNAGIKQIEPYAFSDEKIGTFTAEGVEKLNEGAFYNAKANSLNLPAVKEIGSNAFCGFSYNGYEEQQSVRLPRLEKIGVASFSDAAFTDFWFGGTALVTIPHYTELEQPAFGGGLVSEIKIHVRPELLNAYEQAAADPQTNWHSQLLAARDYYGAEITFEGDYE